MVVALPLSGMIGLTELTGPDGRGGPTQLARNNRLIGWGGMGWLSFLGRLG